MTDWRDTNPFGASLNRDGTGVATFLIDMTDLPDPATEPELQALKSAFRNLTDSQLAAWLEAINTPGGMGDGKAVDQLIASDVAGFAAVVAVSRTSSIFRPCVISFYVAAVRFTRTVDVNVNVDVDGTGGCRTTIPDITDWTNLDANTIALRCALSHLTDSQLVTWLKLVNDANSVNPLKVAMMQLAHANARFVAVAVASSVYVDKGAYFRPCSAAIYEAATRFKHRVA